MASVQVQVHYDLEEESVTLARAVDGNAEVYTTTNIGPNGRFAFMLPVDKAGFYYIQLPGREVRLYLNDGLDFKVDVEEEGYRLSGEKAGHNELLREWNRVYSDLRSYTKLGSRYTYEEFFPYFTETILPQYEAFLPKVDTKDRRFNKLMRTAMQADLESQALRFLFSPHSKHPSRDEHMPYYETLSAEGQKFTDADILQVANGMDWVNFYNLYQVMHGGQKRTGEMTGHIRTGLTNIGHDAVREVYIREQLKRSELQGYEYQALMKPLYKYMTSEKSREFLVEFEKDMKSEVGQPGFEFTYNDTEGNPVSFRDFRGKFVYVDIWATWCGPCKQQIPYLKELEEKFEGEDIVFVSISVDEPEDKQQWQQFVKDENLVGVQLMADKAWNSGIVKNYEINGIPRFLLFDRKGKIIENDAMRPSNPELDNQLESLIGG